MFGLKKQKQLNKKQTDTEDNMSVSGIHTMADDLNNNADKSADNSFADSDNVAEKGNSNKKSSPSGPFLNIDSNAKDEPEPNPSIEKVEIISSYANKNPNNLHYDEKTLSSVKKNVVDNAGKKDNTSDGNNIENTDTAGISSGNSKRMSSDRKADILMKKLRALKAKKMLANKKRYGKDLESLGNRRKNVHSYSKKALLIIVVVIIAIVLGGGFYLYVSARNSGLGLTEFLNNKKELVLNYLKIKTSVAPDSKKQQNFQTDDNKSKKSELSDKTNYMIISTNNLNSEGIKDAIEKEFDKIKANDENIYKFVLVDDNAVKLTFTEFSNAIGLRLNTDIGGKLGDEFYLFLFRDNDNSKRVSLVIKTTNPNMADIMRRNENVLVSMFAPLFFADDIKTSGHLFKSSEYKGYKVRYVNLKQNPNISIDYALINDYLMIATSKKSGRLIIDKMISDLKNEEDDIWSNNENKNIDNGNQNNSANDVDSSNNSDSAVIEPQSENESSAIDSDNDEYSGNDTTIINVQ